MNMKRVIWKRVLFWSLPVLMIGWECILRLVWRLFDGTGTTALELPNWWLFSEASEILLNYFWIAFIWAFKRYAKIIAVIVFVWFCVERWLLLTSSVFVEKGLGGWEVTMAVLFMAIKVAPLLVAACILREKLEDDDVTQERRENGNLVFRPGIVALFWLLPILGMGWEYVIDVADKLFFVDAEYVGSLWKPSWLEALGGPLFEAFYVGMLYFCLAFIWGFKRRAKVVTSVTFVFYFLLVSLAVIASSFMGSTDIGYLLVSFLYTMVIYAPIFFVAYKLIGRISNVGLQDL